jgi:muconolactone delta-isomerase
VEYFTLLDKRGKARVFPVVGLKGYATFFDVSSHEELLRLLRGNPMHPVEEYRIYALGEFPPKAG